MEVFSMKPSQQLHMQTGITANQHPAPEAMENGRRLNAPVLGPLEQMAQVNHAVHRWGTFFGHNKHPKTVFAMSRHPALKHDVGNIPKHILLKPTLPPSVTSLPCIQVPKNPEPFGSLSRRNEEAILLQI
jgi:hypothetical protein